MRIKSKEIAKALGLSTATISLVINGKSGVNEETRKRVLEYIKEREYEELGIPQSKAQVKGGVIAVLHYYKHGIIMRRAKGLDVNPMQRNSVYENSLQEKPVQEKTIQETPVQENSMKEKLVHDPLYEMEKEAFKAGYRLLISYYNEAKDDLDSLLSYWKKEQILGLYIIGAEMKPSDIFPFAKLKIPIVVGDNNFIEQGFDSFLIDNQEGICRAVDYLIDKGHSQVVYLAENIDIFNFLERREAFVKEMSYRNCGDAKSRIWYLGNNLEAISKTLTGYLNTENRLPTAFILESSMISLGAAKAIMERGLRIPRDVSLLGFDALPEDSIPGFDLTLIKGTHTRRHIGAIKHLIRHIEEKEVEIIRVYYKTRLIEGNSVFDKAKYNYMKSRNF